MSGPVLAWAPLFNNVKAPYKKRETDSGYDIYGHRFISIIERDAMYSHIHENERSLENDNLTSILLRPSERVRVGAGFVAAVIPPEDAPEWMAFDISVVSRSGYSYTDGVVVANQPGTVDISYRGEIIVTLINLSHTPKEITLGTRIAQLIIRPFAIAELAEHAVDNLPVPKDFRGSQGFGSSGRE